MSRLLPEKKSAILHPGRLEALTLLQSGNTGRRTYVIPNPHFWWYDLQYIPHIKKAKYNYNCHPLQNYVFPLWWKTIRNSSRTIQSRDTKETTETAFSAKLTDNSIRQKQTFKHFEHQQEKKDSSPGQASPSEQVRQTEVTHSDGVSYMQGWALQFQPVCGSAFLGCAADRKRNPQPHLRLFAPFFL